MAHDYNPQPWGSKNWGIAMNFSFVSVFKDIFISNCVYRWSTEKDTRSLRAGDRGNCEPPLWGSWEPNSGPLYEQSELLAAEPSLQARLPWPIYQGQPIQHSEFWVTQGYKARSCLSSLLVKIKRWIEKLSIALDVSGLLWNWLFLICNRGGNISSKSSFHY